jgi:ribosomal protein L40E
LEDARKGVKGLCAEYAKSYKSLPPIPCSVTERQARIGNAKGFEFIVEAGTSVSGNAVYYDGFIVKGYVLLRGVNEVYVTNYWAPMPWLYRTYHEQADVSMQSLRFVVKTTYDAEGVPRAISSVTVDEASYAGDDLPRIMWLEYKSAHRLSVEAVLAEAETRYLFDIWNDGSHDISRTIAIEPDDRGGLSYVARYVAQYHLTVRSDHGDPQGDGWYDSGTVATISVNSPVPEAGIMGILGGRYLFASWKGDRGFSSTEPVTRINVTEPQVVAPIWREDYSITYTGIAMVYGVIIAAGLFTLLVQPDRVTPRATPERTKVKFCRFCGAKILPDSKYCKECGTKLS